MVGCKKQNNMTRLERKKEKQVSLFTDYKKARRSCHRLPVEYRGVRKKLKGLKGAKKGLLSKRAWCLAGDRTLYLIK